LDSEIPKFWHEFPGVADSSETCSTFQSVGTLRVAKVTSFLRSLNFFFGTASCRET
jgi:hypothetical protein